MSAFQFVMSALAGLTLGEAIAIGLGVAILVFLKRHIA